MVKIQISTGYLEVVANTNVPLNLSAGDIRDISKKSGAFSKSIEFTGSKSNIEQLGYLYDVNIDDATFNINTLTECSIIQNGTTVLERGYLQLISVNKNEQSSVSDELITFTGVIKDDAGDFFTNISNKYLTDLDFSDLVHEFNATNVINSFTHTVADGYKYPLPYTPTNNIPIKEFKPAIYAKTYLDRIFARAGKSYTWNDLSNCRFDKLLIPYNGDGSRINIDAYKVAFDKSVSHSGTHISGVVNINNQQPLVSVTETIDVAGIFNPTTGQYTAPFYVATGESINVSANVSRYFALTNPIGSSARIKYQDQNTSPAQWVAGSAQYTVGLFAYRNGVQVAATPISQKVINSVLASGTTVIENDSVVVNLSITGLNQGDIITFRIRYVNQFVQGKWVNNTTNANVAVQYSFSNSAFLTVTPSENNTGLFADIDFSKMIPNQIKQSDFVKSILTMYNLFAIPDPSQPDNIILINRDDYYDSGAQKDWTKKTANNREKTIQFLPDLTAKKMQLSYKDDSDEVNKFYKQGTNETFGQVEYSFDNEYIKGIDRKEIIFSPTPSAVTSFGAIVPMLSGSAPKTNIRILIDNGAQSSTMPINIIQYTGSVFSSSTYAQASHFENPATPSFDINFGLCDYYLYSIESPTGNNLYNLYWRRTLAQLNKGKMLTAYFNLDESDIQSLKLNDKIFVERAWWNINRVIDYNANDKQLTKVELISVDEGIRLAPFKTRVVRPSTAVDFLPIRNDIVKKFYDNNNVINGGQVFGEIGKSVTDGEVVVKNLVAETINGITYTDEPQYKAIVTQSGTNAPVITTVLRNDLNIEVTPVYVTNGQYKFAAIGDFPTVITTEANEAITTEEGYYLILESDTSNMIESTILEAKHNGNLPQGNEARFYINSGELYLDTFDSGTLTNGSLPTDINWVVTLTFYAK